MSSLTTLASQALCVPLVIDGVDAIRNPDSHSEKFLEVIAPLEKLGLPPIMGADATAISRTAGAITVAAGLGVLLRRSPRVCAGVLAAISVPVAVTNNAFWLSSARQRGASPAGLARGLALTAGLVLAAADRGGKPSRAWKRANQDS